MKYEKPEINIEKFEFNDRIANDDDDIMSSNYDAAPTIEENDPLIEVVESAFENVFKF